MGRSREHPIRNDWERAKDEVMRTAVRRKFETHFGLRERLSATGDEEFVKTLRTTTTGAAGEDGSGKNMLGRN